MYMPDFHRLLIHPETRMCIIESEGRIVVRYRVQHMLNTA